MAINIGVTGSTGRFIGGGAGVYRNTQLKLYLDPFKYSAYTGESDGTFEDLSGWGNNITLVGGAQTRSNGYWSFDGTDDFGYRTDDSDFDYGQTTDFSLQFWFRNLGGDVTIGLMGKGNDFSTGWYLWRSTNENLYLGIGSASTLYSGGSSVDWESGWQNVAICVDRSSNAKFYQNGILVATDTSTSTAYNISTDRYLVIGGIQGSNSTTSANYELNGFMGQVMIYSGKVLSEDEVRQNFNAHRGIYGV